MRISQDSMSGWQPGVNENPLSALVLSRDYSGLNKQDDQLRLWLPEAARLGLGEVTKRVGTSITVYLTEYFATHLYGHHELLRMREGRVGLYEPLPHERGKKSCAMGTTTSTEPNLGKNIFALKIFIPKKIKEDLGKWAEISGMSLGQFGRILICAHLFGRDYGPRDIPGTTPDELQRANHWEVEDEQN